MSLALQVKLLRARQEQSLARVGGNRSVRADVRIIAATDRNPEEAIARGDFREDLYYRLGLIWLNLPPTQAQARHFMSPATLHGSVQPAA
jgi:transcriptional regulator with PAS, ATPase and Fis domain